MQLTIKNLYIKSSTVGLILIDLILLLGLSHNFLFAMISSLYILFVPGLLVLQSLNLFKLKPGIKLIYALGLSISIIMFGGLILNWMNLPPIYLHNPLTQNPIIIGYNLLIILLILLVKITKHVQEDVLAFEKSLISSIPYILFPIIYLLFSIAGANTLNNNGSGFISTMTLGLIGIYVLILMVKRKKVPNYIWPYAVFTIAYSMLLLLSLRSWHITGWDINQEYQMYQVTKLTGMWRANSIGNAYYSCLSLTIFPTVISYITHIPDESIFKVIYPFIFSFVPLTMFYLFRKYTRPVFSFFAVFFFISQPWFIQPMAAIARQEVALLFFILLLFVLLSSKKWDSTKYLLFIVFGLSMVVSHYSTTYITIGLYLASYFIIFILRCIKDRNNIMLFSRHPKFPKISFSHIYSDLRFLPILLILVFSILWYSVITNTGNNLQYVLGTSFNNINNLFKNEMKSEDLQASLALFTPPSNNTVQNIKKYYDDELKLNENKLLKKNTYPNNTSVSLKPINDSQVNPIINTSINKMIFKFLDILKIIMKLLLLIGPLCMFIIKWRKSKMSMDLEVIGLVGLGALGLMYILPVISQYYNLTRVYIQVLIVLSYTTIYFGYMLLKYLNKRFTYSLLGVFLVIYFLFLSGFMTQIFGGYAFMHLNNYGEDYDKFYTHQQEVNSAIWMKQNISSKNDVYADEVSALRLYSYGNFYNINNTLLPGLITKDSYVYLRYANVVKNRVDTHYKNIVLTYTLPISFISENKNLIYNNGGSEVFK